MAKGKQKKKHKIKKPPLKTPPLSRLDKFIYGIWFTLAVIVPLLFFAGLIILQRAIAFSDSTVIASAERATIFWATPFLLFVIIALIASCETARQKKQPLFGLKDFPYGSPEYTEVYPLFRKKKYASAKLDRPSHKKHRKHGMMAVILCFVICVSLLPLSFFGRDSLHEDMSISAYNVFNSEKRHYEAANVTSVTFSIYYQSGGRYNSGGWQKAVTLETSDGRTYHYEPDLDTLCEIKEAFPAAVISYRGQKNVETYIEKYHYGADKAAKLRALFEVTK